MMDCQALGRSETYFDAASFTCNSPRSWRRRIEAPVNCFVSEAMRNFVDGLLFTFHS